MIAKVFTRQLGVRSYILKGVRKGKGGTKQNLLQPMSYLDMTVYDNPKKQLQNVKEMHPHQQWQRLASDFVRSSLLFFMDEVLYKTLREEEPNEPLFDYVVSQLDALDKDEVKLSSLPIHFLLHTAHHIGIEPLNNYSHHEPLFNLKEGRFLAPPSLYSSQKDANIDYFLTPEQSAHLHYYVQAMQSRQPAPLLTLSQRSALINILIQYFQLQLSEFRQFHSHEILHTVLE